LKLEYNSKVLLDLHMANTIPFMDATFFS